MPVAGTLIAPTGLYGVGPEGPSGPPGIGAGTSLTITAAGTHTIPAGITWVFVNVEGSVSLILPPSGQVKIWDRGPQAGSWPITIYPPAGRTINGGSQWVIATDWGTAEIVFDGSDYAVG